MIPFIFVEKRIRARISWRKSPGFHSACASLEGGTTSVSKMAEKTVLVTQQLLKPIKVLKWKVSPGNSISIGSVILLYDFEGATVAEQRKLKSTQAGTVHKLIAPEGAIVPPGWVFLRILAGTISRAKLIV